MELYQAFQTFISACGAAIVSGIFSLILAKSQAKKEKKKETDRISEQIDSLSGKLDEHIAQDAESKADDARSRIIRFGDEVRRGIPHTEEHWVDILRDVDRYEDYCEAHPSYENNRATRTIAHIKEVYDEHLRKNDFLK